MNNNPNHSINCNVTNCCHNDNSCNCCTLNSIKVSCCKMSNVDKATNKDDTICSNFTPKN